MNERLSNMHDRMIRFNKHISRRDRREKGQRRCLKRIMDDNYTELIQSTNP
jgi:hypothetical protein